MNVNIEKEIKGIISVEVTTAIEELDAEVGDIFCRIDDDMFECKVSRNYEDSSYDATTRINETVLVKYAENFKVNEMTEKGIAELQDKDNNDKIEIYKSDLEGIKSLIIDSLRLTESVDFLLDSNDELKGNIGHLISDLENKLNNYVTDRDSINGYKEILDKEYVNEATAVLSNLIILLTYIINKLNAILQIENSNTNARYIN